MSSTAPVEGKGKGASSGLAWVGVALAAVSILFALLTIEHAIALAGGWLDLQTRVEAWLTSEAFIFGEGNIRYTVPWYESALLRMTVHMALGGVALGLGVLQFFPSLRRRYPKWHRASGVVAWIATLLSMLGSLGFLAFVPMAKGSSGPAVHVGLWALTLLVLLLLWQAVLAAWSRDFRSHMIWMAMVFAGLATAPMLRIDWIVFFPVIGSYGHEQVNLAVSAFVFMQTLAIMALWLSVVGDRDLRARPAGTSAWPRWLILLLCTLSVLGALQEGLLAPRGIGDPFGAWRGAGDRMSGAGVLWAIATIAAMLALPAAWRGALEGKPLSRTTSAAVAAVAIGAVGIGLDYDRGALARFGSAYFWLGYGVFVALALVFSHAIKPNSAGRNAWALIALAALWLPSQLNGLLALGLAVGTTFAESMAQALVNGVGGIIVAGIATGFGARLRWRVTRP